jgi:hypothetical protein
VIAPLHREITASASAVASQGQAQLLWKLSSPSAANKAYPNEIPSKTRLYSKSCVALMSSPSEALLAGFNLVTLPREFFSQFFLGCPHRTEVGFDGKTSPTQHATITEESHV